MTFSSYVFLGSFGCDGLLDFLCLDVLDSFEDYWSEVL